jgi:hypothetical protein
VASSPWRRVCRVLVPVALAALVGTFATPAGASTGTAPFIHLFGGYIANPSGVDSVSGDVTVPTITCTSPKPQDLNANIGLMGSSTEAQGGVLSQCLHGSPLYTASGTAGLVTFHMPVNPGDVVAVTANQSTRGTTVTETDLTTSLSASAQAPGAVPTRAQLGNFFNRRSVSIPTFSTEGFSNAMVDGAALGSTNPTEENLRGKHRKVLISAGSLTSGGTAFTMTFVSP